MTPLSRRFTFLSASSSRLGLLHVLAVASCACANVQVNDDEAPPPDHSSGGNTTLVDLGGASAGGRLVGLTGGASGSGGATNGSGGSTSSGGGTGGAPGSGGSTGSGLSIEDCTPLEFNTNSGSFGTTGAKCFTTEMAPPTTWDVYNGEGRTIWVNQVEMTPGTLPWPGSSPYMVDFSEGSYDYTSWSYY